MINILPPSQKEERRYGRLNNFMIRQLVSVVIIGALGVGFMLSGLRIVQSDEENIQADIATKQLEYAELKPIENEASALNRKVGAIEELFEREVKFSALLKDIAGALPIQTRLKSLSLTGSKTEPISIVAQVDTQELAAVLRKSLVDSGIFELADISSITPGDIDGNGGIKNYEVSITADFAGSADLRKAEKAARDAADQAALDAAAGGSE